MEGIKDLIETEIDGFKKNKITVVEGFDFNQYERIRKNYRLYHSKYKNGKFEKDDKGNNIFRKYYFNETRNPCNTATKEIDWDVKDIEINGRGPNDRYKAWFFQKDLEIWMAKNNFANLINRTVLNIPKIGSQVWKFIENEPYLVDMRNFFVDPSADCLDEASYIIERHFYNPRTFFKKAEEFRKLNTLEEKAEKLSDLMTRFKNMKMDIASCDPKAGYNRALVAAWSSFFLVCHSYKKEKKSELTMLFYNILELGTREKIGHSIRGPPHYGL
ncbi:MAG: hypothetical protein ACOC1P_05580 [Minisyncoccales bacterium]